MTRECHLTVGGEDFCPRVTAPYGVFLHTIKMQKRQYF
ncbi:hypothetical protein CKA32_002662 [Geitlerinema sp. FC II]|nr:hypothetical protein CKA32_002662 [Geitlerinema sp. FC II]